MIHLSIVKLTSFCGWPGERHPFHDETMCVRARARERIVVQYLVGRVGWLLARSRQWSAHVSIHVRRHGDVARDDAWMRDRVQHLHVLHLCKHTLKCDANINFVSETVIDVQTCSNWVECLHSRTTSHIIVYAHLSCYGCSVFANTQVHTHLEHALCIRMWNNELTNCRHVFATRTCRYSRTNIEIITTNEWSRPKNIVVMREKKVVMCFVSINHSSSSKPYYGSSSDAYLAESMIVFRRMLSGSQYLCVPSESVTRAHLLFSSLSVGISFRLCGGWPRIQLRARHSNGQGLISFVHRCLSFVHSIPFCH